MLRNSRKEARKFKNLFRQLKLMKKLLISHHLQWSIQPTEQRGEKNKWQSFNILRKNWGWKTKKLLWWETGSISKTRSSAEKFFKWTVPIIKEAKFVKVTNNYFRANNRILKDQVGDLEKYLKLIQDELKRRGIKITVIEESIAKSSEIEEGTSWRLEWLCFFSWYGF